MLIASRKSRSDNDLRGYLPPEGAATKGRLINRAVNRLILRPAEELANRPIINLCQARKSSEILIPTLAKRFFANYAVTLKLRPGTRQQLSPSATVASSTGEDR